MSLIDDKSIFTAMKQNGPFAVTDGFTLGRPFTRQTRSWARQFGDDRLLVTKYRVVRAQIFDFLQIEDFAEVPGLLADPAARARRSERACLLLGNLFGIAGSTSEIRSKIKEYAQTADAVINLLRDKLLAPYASHVEISNEIETTHDPVDLLLRVFDDRFHMKTRFEAKRKLVLMNLAGSIDQRERETDIENKFYAFLEFLNRNVWSPRHKIGQLEIAYLLSRHDPDDFRCLDVKVIDAASRANLKALGEGEKLTLLKRRVFEDDGREIPAYVSVRKKDSAAKVLKLLRKNEKNPAVAVDDELGLMAVLDSVSDVKRFVRHMTRSAIKSGSLMTLEDISDTLTGGLLPFQCRGQQQPDADAQVLRADGRHARGTDHPHQPVLPELPFSAGHRPRRIRGEAHLRFGRGRVSVSRGHLRPGYGTDPPEPAGPVPQEHRGFRASARIKGSWFYPSPITPAYWNSPRTGSTPPGAPVPSRACGVPPPRW